MAKTDAKKNLLESTQKKISEQEADNDQKSKELKTDQTEVNA